MVEQVVLLKLHPNPVFRRVQLGKAGWLRQPLCPDEYRSGPVKIYGVAWFLPSLIGSEHPSMSTLNASPRLKPITYLRMRILLKLPKMNHFVPMDQRRYFNSARTGSSPSATPAPPDSTP